MFLVIISISIYNFGIYLILVLSICNAIQSADCHVRYFNKLSIYLSKATKVVLACCALHNMLLCKSSRSYCPPGSMDYENENGDVITGLWRESGSSNPSNFRSMPEC